MYYPDQQQFIKLCKKGNLVPIYTEINGDLDTPVSVYYKLAQKAKFSCLLESVEGEEKISRYSFIAKDPEVVFQSKKNTITITRFKDKKASHEKIPLKESPLPYIREIMNQYKFVNIEGLPRFCGGMIGYLSYDVVKFFEKLPSKTKDDLKLPECMLMLSKHLVIFDHVNHKIKIVHCIDVDPKSSETAKKKAYKKGINAIEKTILELLKPLKVKQNKNGRNTNNSLQLRFKSNFSQGQFEDIVKKAKAQIRAGEIIQVVLSQRFEVNLQTEPFNIYRALRALNPSPYMYYLNLGKLQIIGASPELLVRCEGGVVETRPIAGTRPRGKNEKEDEALAKDLLKDPKERAEHIMLVDLGRNDLGRVCKKGSVRVSEFMKVEKYSHVMHIVSNVEGRLNPKMDDFDVLKAAFPAGTLSGAPKIRAMEIIEDLENNTRGPYAGCIGYFSFSGNLDTCITIRTIVATKSKAYIQAGAGIVADSNPKTEYQETVNKAKAQLKAIEIAHRN